MKARRILNIVIVLLVIGAAAVAISWRLSENKETMETNSQLTVQRDVAIPVTTAPVSRQSFSNEFTVNGTFRPSKEITVISDVNGRITSLKIDDGTYVKENQLLLTVDNQLLENQLKSLQLNLSKGQKDLARMKNLLQDGGVTETQFEEAKLGVENLEIQIASLKKQIADTYLKAPMSGTITELRVEKGSYLAPGAPVANIVNINPIELETFLTEDQVVTIKPGQQIRLTVDVQQGKEFTGRISFIDVKADASKRFAVRITLANSGSIRAGMNGRATFSAGQPVATLAVPRSAFVGSTSSGKVYVLENGRAKLRKVEAGNQVGNQVIIFGGLSEGETVILSGQINLQDDSEVTVVNAEQ